jgi:hypothetical protein
MDFDITRLVRELDLARRFILSQSRSRRLAQYDRFAHFHASEGRSLSVLFEEFGRLRAENLAGRSQAVARILAHRGPMTS